MAHGIPTQTIAHCRRLIASSISVCPFPSEEVKLGFWDRYLARYRFCRLFGHYSHWRAFATAMRDALASRASGRWRGMVCRSTSIRALWSARRHLTRPKQRPSSSG